jgi:hypothetical protein
MSGPVMRAVRTEASRRPLQVPADSGDVRLSDIFDLTWSASFAHRGVVTRLVPSACTDELLMLGTNIEHGNWILWIGSHFCLKTVHNVMG